MRSNALPEAYIFGLDTPLIFLSDKLFQVGRILEQPQDENLIKLNEQKFSLEQLASPSQFDALYLAHNADNILPIQQRFIQTYSRDALQSASELNDRVRSNKTAMFIVEKVLPLITGGLLEEKIGNVLADRQQTRRQTTDAIPPQVLAEIGRIKSDLIAKIEQEYNLPPDRMRDAFGTRQTFSSSSQHSVLRKSLEKIFGISNAFILEDRVYSLITIKDYIAKFQDAIHPETFRDLLRIPVTRVPEDAAMEIRSNKGTIERAKYSLIVNKIRTMYVRIDGQYTIPFLVGRTDDLKVTYNRFLERTIKINAVEQLGAQNEQLYKLAQERTSASAITTQSRYEKNGAGFERRDGRYYVFVKTPEYALKSPHKTVDRKYVPFPAATVGVEVSYTDSGYFTVGAPIVMNAYRHPFLSGSYAMQTLCLGQWRAENVPGYSRMPAEKKIELLLDQGKKTLLMGYKTGANPYNRLDERWTEWLTKREVEQRRLVVLNDFGGRT